MHQKDLRIRLQQKTIEKSRKNTIEVDFSSRRCPFPNRNCGSKVLCAVQKILSSGTTVLLPGSGDAPNPLYLGISHYQFCPENLCSESVLIATLHTQPPLQERPQILVSEMYFGTGSHSSLSFLSPSRLYLSRSKEATIVLPYRNRPPSDNEGTWAWRRRRRNQSALQRGSEASGRKDLALLPAATPARAVEREVRTAPSEQQHRRISEF